MRGKPMISTWRLVAVFAIAIFGSAFSRPAVADELAPAGTSEETAAQVVAQMNAEAGANVPGTYFVVGSFRLVDNVERMIDELVGLDARMSVVFVKEKVYFRVVVGPLSEAETTSARARLVDYGINNPWTINLCSADLTPPPCDTQTGSADSSNGIAVASN